MAPSSSRGRASPSERGGRRRSRMRGCRCSVALVDLVYPVPLGIVVGLFTGKQIGITGASLAGVGLRIASLPDGVRWTELYAMAVLCGIGFIHSECPWDCVLPTPATAPSVAAWISPGPSAGDDVAAEGAQRAGDA